jgi:hypothetical protein
MCQIPNSGDPDRVEAKEYALSSSQGLRFNIELQFGPVEKEHHARLARELQCQLQEILQDGRLTVRIGDDYLEPLRVGVIPIP